ncbi:MAG: hypothetical protein AB7U85_10430, partial [Alphaproteobacteria bacterium]
IRYEFFVIGFTVITERSQLILIKLRYLKGLNLLISVIKKGAEVIFCSFFLFDTKIERFIGYIKEID